MPTDPNQNVHDTTIHTEGTNEGTEDRTANKSDRVRSLSPREYETFILLLGGITLRETAAQLGVGYSTANTYVNSIYRKLGVSSRAQLIIGYRDINKNTEGFIMAECKKCGARFDDDKLICPFCGTVCTGEHTTVRSGITENPSQTTTDGTAQPGTVDATQADITQNKTMGILAYLSWLVLIPLLAAKDSAFARFHANQGLVLALTEIAWWIIEGILSTILYGVSWTIGSIVSSLLGLANILFLVLTVIGIINAANGKVKELPVIGRFRLIK